MRTILFPTDFSERADMALTQAVDFAEKFSAKIIIYHVYHHPVNNGGGNPYETMSFNNLKNQIDARFKSLFHVNTKLKKVAHEFVKELGISVENIIAYTKKEPIDLIIMSTKGAKVFGELWGTKTAEIVKNVLVPVLVIPENTNLSTRKVGLLCDYSSETDYHTLDLFIEISEGLKLDTHVITLNRDEKLMTPQEKAYRQLVRKKLESLPVTFNVSFHRYIEQGIILHCLANDIGLIAILPKHYKFIEQLFHESLTQKMTFHSPIPLLILK